MTKTIDSSRQLAIWLLKYASERGVPITLRGDAQMALLKIFDDRPHDYWYFSICRELIDALGLEDCIFVDFDEVQWHASVELVKRQGPLAECNLDYVIPPVDPKWLEGNKKWFAANRRAPKKGRSARSA